MSYADNFSKMQKGFDMGQAIAEADRCLLCHDAPCSKGCPAETDPASFIRKAAVSQCDRCHSHHQNKQHSGGGLWRALPHG